MPRWPIFPFLQHNRMPIPSSAHEFRQAARSHISCTTALTTAALCLQISVRHIPSDLLGHKPSLPTQRRCEEPSRRSSLTATHARPQEGADAHNHILGPWYIAPWPVPRRGVLGPHLVEKEGELELGLHAGIGLERVWAGHAPSGHSEIWHSAAACCPPYLPVSVTSASSPLPSRLRRRRTALQHYTKHNGRRPATACDSPARTETDATRHRRRRRSTRGKLEKDETPGWLVLLRNTDTMTRVHG